MGICYRGQPAQAARCEGEQAQEVFFFVIFVGLVQIKAHSARNFLLRPATQELAEAARLFDLSDTQVHHLLSPIG